MMNKGHAERGRYVSKWRPPPTRANLAPWILSQHCPAPLPLSRLFKSRCHSALKLCTLHLIKTHQLSELLVSLNFKYKIATNPQLLVQQNVLNVINNKQSSQLNINHSGSLMNFITANNMGKINKNLIRGIH